MRDSGPAHHFRPTRGQPLGGALGEFPQGGVHPRLLHPPGGRQAGALHRDRRQFGRLPLTGLGRSSPIEVQHAQRIGPEPTQPGGDRPPGGQRPAMPHGLRHRIPHDVDASRLSQRFVELAGAGVGHLLRHPLVAVGLTKVVPRPRYIGCKPGGRGMLALHRRGDGLTQRLDTQAGQRRGRDELRLPQALEVQQLPQVTHCLSELVAGEPVSLVEHHEHHVGMAGKRLQVVVVQGGVCVLLRVDHPDQHVDQLDQAVDLLAVCGLCGVVVGQIDQDQAVERRVVALHEVPPWHVQPVEQVGGQLRPPVGSHRLARGRTLQPRLGKPGARDGIEEAGLA